jgi:hypothetical protein
MEKEFEEEKYKYNQKVDLLEKEKNNVLFELNMEKKNKESEIVKYQNIIATIEKETNFLRNSYEEYKK